MKKKHPKLISILKKLCKLSIYVIISILVFKTFESKNVSRGKNSHINKRTNKPKIEWSRIGGLLEAIAMTIIKRTFYRSYKCTKCDSYHVGGHLKKHPKQFVA